MEVEPKSPPPAGGAAWLEKREGEELNPKIPPEPAAGAGADPKVFDPNKPGEEAAAGAPKTPGCDWPVAGC